jgi:hypothetical protein
MHKNNAAARSLMIPPIRTVAYEKKTDPEIQRLKLTVTDWQALVGKALRRSTRRKGGRSSNSRETHMKKKPAIWVAAVAVGFTLFSVLSGSDAQPLPPQIGRY